MEALSAGIPVIATDAGGTSELVDDFVGKLLPVDITEIRLIAEIENFFYLPDSKKLQLRKNARERWDELANAEKVYSAFAKFLSEI
jgi:glycosyltransferase involved in cell wall biosynthesis